MARKAKKTVAETREGPKIQVAVFHTPSFDVSSYLGASNFLAQYGESETSAGFVGYELIAKDRKGHQIKGICPNKREAIDFLLWVSTRE